MDSRVPTRITIELEPTESRRGGWRARTRVDDRRADRPLEPTVAWAPAPYEPGPCRCEDGLCARDHEHE